MQRPVIPSPLRSCSNYHERARQSRVTLASPLSTLPAAMAFRQGPGSPEQAWIPVPGGRWIPMPPLGPQGAQHHLPPPPLPLPPPGFVPAIALHPAFGLSAAHPSPFPTPFMPPFMPMVHPQPLPGALPGYQPSGALSPPLARPGLGSPAPAAAEKPVPSLPADPFGVEEAGGCGLKSSLGPWLGAPKTECCFPHIPVLPLLVQGRRVGSRQCIIIISSSPTHRSQHSSGKRGHGNRPPGSSSSRQQAAPPALSPRRSAPRARPPDATARPSNT